MSFTAPTRPRSLPVLPLAAMIDVLFLLLIFFMTTSIFREQERMIDVSLPATESALPQAPQSPIVITVTRDGTIYLGDRPYDLDELRTTLDKLGRDFPDETVEIRGDGGSPLRRTIQVMDAAYAAGLHNVFLATIKRAAEIE